MDSAICSKITHPERTRPPATPAGLTSPTTMTTTKLNTVYRIALRQEIRDRLWLARHAKSHGLRVARLWHVEQAADARRKLRNLTTP